LSQSWSQSYDFDIYIQLQRQRCSSIKRFKTGEKLFIFKKRSMLLAALKLVIVGLAPAITGYNASAVKLLQRHD
jgi:hypothetical protein